ncbi:hypothetical protein [Streptomyces massasporeus]|uniref:hypothetical protein n=1 Tax=Streptomyces massasporeus TaxID=67324 RepID=UPI0036A07E7A
MTERAHVKYPFEIDGRWVLRYHIPYDVEHEGRSFHVVATIFGKPEVHGRIHVGCEGTPVVRYDDLTPGDTVDITGDEWRVTAVDYRTRIVLERVQGHDTAHRESEEETGGEAGD